MTDSLLNMAKELTVAQVESGNFLPEDMSRVLNSVYKTLSKLNAAREAESVAPVAINSVDWKQSITQHAVICLECGTSFKQLSRKHLNQHNLDIKSYRNKFGIPSTQSLVARQTQARRREIAKQVKPWEKTKK